MNNFSLTIIGSGNVAYHLVKELVKHNYCLSIFSRNNVSANKIAKEFSINLITNVNEIKDRSIVIVCVNDEQVIPVIDSLKPELKIIYTSGSTSIDDIKEKKFIACLYPMQTFNKEVDVNFKKVPLFIESTSNEFLEEIKQIAKNISDHVYILNSKQRLFLHIAAIFANNFSSYLQLISQQILEKNNIPIDVLDELRKQTCKKWESFDLKSTQTGPAKRNDREILLKHLSVLSGKEHDIYKLLSNSILETYDFKKL